VLRIDEAHAPRASGAAALDPHMVQARFSFSDAGIGYANMSAHRRQFQ